MVAFYYFCFFPHPFFPVLLLPAPERRRYQNVGPIDSGKSASQLESLLRTLWQFPVCMRVYRF
jgi:hypothetical protein